MTELHPYDWAVTGPPIGIWTSAVGSFSVMMEDTLTISADGMGSLHTHSVFRGDETIDLVWRHLSPGVMQIVTLDDGLLPSAITEDMWDQVKYIADWHTSDVGGRQPVLKNKHYDDFWTLTGAMRLVESV